MKTNKNAVIKTVICILTFSFFFLMITFFKPQVINIMSELALKSAKSYMPTAKTEKIKPSETAVSSETTKETTGQETTSVTETTTATTTKQIETTAKKAVTVSSDKKFTNTDEDILNLIKEAKKTSKKDKKDGKISEYQYINDGVTDRYGKVRVKNVNKTDINIKKLLETELELSVNKKEPSVLIFQTHTTETYQILDRDFYAVGSLTRSKDKNVNMLRVGQEITEEIEKAGYKVIFDDVIHDLSYNGAYAHSRKTVEEYLKEYPSIKIVLDIHRDAIQRSDGTKIKPTATVNNKKAAQIMIISGCQEEGNSVKDFPDWKENLVFAVHLQSKLEELFEGITRPLYFSPRKYNMDLTPCSLLVEVGSDANTVEEAVYTGRCLGKAVSEILKEYEG